MRAALLLLGLLLPAPGTYALLPSSRFEVHTGKAGLLGVFGHDHVIRADSFSGTVVWDPERPHDSRVEIHVPGAAVHVVRRGADRDDGPDVEKAMREDVLQVDRYSEIAFVSRTVTAIEGGLHVVGELTLVGSTRPVAVDVTISTTGDTLRARGSFKVRQTTFGIRPYRAAGGTIRVADEVEFDVDAVAVRTDSE